MEHYFYGRKDSRNILLQPEGGYDAEREKMTGDLVRELSGTDDFLLVTVPVNSWNHDLSPWNAPPIFGKEAFGDGAKETLLRITSELLPELTSELPDPGAHRYIIGGYSLAGLFALWAVFETDCFCASAAASPSVWFPGFMDYLKNRPILTQNVYLSLGDREEKAKNRAFAAVGDCIRECDRILHERGVNSILAWNSGNHFVDGELRMAKGFAWTLQEVLKTDNL